ncbi:MAG TPA: DUF1592 domain-containing protein [Polyangiaceae bacterium]|nr:DUF1592 domain-containing protein [Polyangiaceae bacterium]
MLGLEPTQLDPAVVGSGIPQELPSTGLFRNGADGQAAADEYPLAFGKMAAAVAEQVDIAALSAGFGACADDDACATSFVSGLGKQLFRRPLSQRESDAFLALYAAVLAEDPSVDRARRSVVEAMLQSPAFVFRLERELGGAAGEKRYLDGYELASRLSFFLWDSAPDDDLLALADTEGFNGSAEALPVLRQQVKRMLQAPRARRLTRELVRDFAGTDHARFVGITPALRTSLFESMVATVDQQLWQEQGTLAGLFTTTRMSLDPNAAKMLGFTPTGAGQHIYDVSALPERVGWLTHPGFIAGMGDADQGKLVHRGITLMVKLLCRQPLQLPEGLAATTAEFATKFADLTERQRSEERRAMARPVAEGGSNNPACWACHSQFEPLAYGFNRFDAAGRYVGETDEQGRELPVDGWMTDDLNVDEAARARYANVAELMQLMSESSAIQACMAEHFLAFSTGRASSAIEKDFSHRVRVAEEQAGGTLPAMVEAVATSELFRALASSGPAPTEEP